MLCAVVHDFNEYFSLGFRFEPVNKDFFNYDNAVEIEIDDSVMRLARIVLFGWNKKTISKISLEYVCRVQKTIHSFFMSNYLNFEPWAFIIIRSFVI